MIIFGIEDQSTHSFRDRKFNPAVYGIGPFGRIFETGAAKRRLQDRRQFGFGVFSIGIRGEDRQAHGWHRRSRGFHLDTLDPRGAAIGDDGLSSRIVRRVVIATQIGADIHILLNVAVAAPIGRDRSEEHTSELQSLMRISYAVFCMKKKKTNIPLTSKQTTD